MTPDSTSVTDTGGGAGDGAEVVANQFETLEELLSTKGRFRLREMAHAMKESGALKIKDHRLIQGNFPNSFKGECASTMGLLTLVPFVLVLSPCVIALFIQVGQAMLDLSIFHCVTNSSTFDVKHLYAFRSDNLGTVANLQRRVVAIEDQNLAQTKANKEAQADAVTKSVQMDWRISVAERRLAASEGALRRAIAVQQVVIGTLLALLFVTFAPLGRLSTYLAALGIVVLIVVLLESRRVLNDFISFQIDYRHIASGIMGLHMSEEQDHSMMRAPSLDNSSQGIGSATLDVATGTLIDVLSGVLDGVKSSLESAWNRVMSPKAAESLERPRSILNSSGRRKEHLTQRTSFTLPSDDAGDSRAAPQVEREPDTTSARLTRRATPVIFAVADAAVAEGLWMHTSQEPAPVSSWHSQDPSSARRDASDWPRNTQMNSRNALRYLPQSGGPAPFAAPFVAPSVGAPPGPPSAVDFEGWWTPDMVRERNQRHRWERSEHPRSYRPPVLAQ